jgi:hypothetical protein
LMRAVGWVNANLPGRHSRVLEDLAGFFVAEEALGTESGAECAPAAELVFRGKREVERRDGLRVRRPHSPRCCECGQGDAATLISIYF